MADWAAPFRIPKYTSAEFRKLKADYVAKHGYTITIPGLYDIIKIPIEEPMTQKEVTDWKAGRFSEFSEDRLYHIKVMKQKRKDKFLAMLASPAPEIVANAGALMTAIDNAQDAIFTIAAMGFAAMRFAPPPVAAILAVPTGATLTAASALSVIQSLGSSGFTGIAAKRSWQRKTSIDPWSKQGRLKYAEHLIKTFPKKAIAIQALQTTEAIFGIGLSLGPIVGLFIDSIAGPIRRILGDKVSVSLPIPTYDQFTEAAQHNARTASAYFYPGVQTKDEEVIAMMLAHWHGQMALFSGTQDKPGWENFENLDQIELKMPVTTNPLSLEVMAEEGIDAESITNWPHNGKPWALSTDIAEEYEKPCQDYFAEYTRRHKSDWIGYIFQTLACDSTMYTLAAAEGESQVEQDYTITSKVCSMFLEFKKYPTRAQPPEKLKMLADQIDLWEHTGYKPAFREIESYCSNNNILLTSF